MNPVVCMLIILAVFSFMILRIDLYYYHGKRRINEIFSRPDWREKSDEFRKENSWAQIFSFHKWTYRQFYPE